MKLPAILEVASLPPGTCMICGCNSGPMIDTMIEYDIYGRQYICLNRCVPMLAELTGYGSPEQMATLEEDADGLRAAIAGLKEDLEIAKNSKLISLDDARELNREAAKARGDAA